MEVEITKETLTGLNLYTSFRPEPLIYRGDLNGSKR